MTKKQQLGPRQKQWIEALKSGKFRQVQEVLVDNDGYCCLGVACVIAKINGVVTQEDIQILKEDQDSFLPDEIVEYFAFNDKEGINKTGRRDSLAILNDVRCKTFKEIAEIVEEDPSEYFSKSV